MKKTLIALSLFALIGSANAQEIIKNQSDSFSVFGGVVAGKTASQYSTESEKSTGYVLGADYTKYLTAGLFVQPSVQFINGRTERNDKHTVALFDVGYTYSYEGITVSPKAGVGYAHSKYNHTYTIGELGVPLWTYNDKGSKNSVAYNVGLEVGFAKNWNVGVNHIRMKGGNGKHADYTTLSLGYKF